MNTGSDIKFAGRLNAFKIGAEAYWPGKNKITTIDLLTRAATGLNAADLNYPDHFADVSMQDLKHLFQDCLLYTSPSPRDGLLSRMPSSA